MGRKSKLTPEQWAQIDRRLVAGERPSHLAKEYGVNPSQITRRGGKEGLAQKTQKVREVAQSLAQAQTALAALPVAEQHTAVRLAEQLRQTSDHLAGASVNASAIAHRLTSIASTEMDKVDDTDPLSTVGHLKSVSTLMNLAKEAAHIPLNLLAANKDRMKSLEEAPSDAPKPVAGLTAQDAARVYQDFISAG
jgi:uncharacterized phage infection (PIP) family protein YhgE